jgi:hypothetical protein
MKSRIGVFALALLLTPPLAFASRGGGSFLRAINPSVKAVGLSEIQQKIQTHALLKDAYLSLGESHGEDETTHPVQKFFLDAYIDPVSPEPIKLCSESIGSFLESAEGKWLQRNVHLTEIYTGNGPSQTDFTKCGTDTYSRYITYSGFFHQTPFARPFPEVFAPTPVVTEDGNNIRDEMGDRKGFFISQIEFPVLELFETNRVFTKFAKNAKSFEAEARALIAQGDSLRTRLAPILPDSSAYTSKKGIFLDQSFFKSSRLEVLPQDAYLLITDLEFRKARPSFYFLSRILTWSADDRKLLEAFLSKWKAYYAQADFAPARDGTPATMTFGLLPQKYRGEAAELTLIHGKNLLFFTMSADDSEMTCIATKSGSEPNATPAPCSDVLRSIAP